MPEITNNFITELKKIGRGLVQLRFFQFKHIGSFIGAASRRERIALAALMLMLLADAGLMSWRFYSRHTIVVPAYGSEYTEGVIGRPRYINPLLAQTQTDKDLAALVYARLYKYDSSGKLVPDLAEGMPQVSADGKQYVIALKQGLKWTDGQPVNADDVIFTVHALQNPDLKSPLLRGWGNITVSKSDDRTVVLANKNASSPFLSNLTLGILPQHIWSKIDPANMQLSDYNLQPVGSGPYFVKELNKLKSGEITAVTLNSYSNYWAGKPYIDTITMRFYNSYQDALFALHSKEIDGFGFIPFDQKIYIDSKTTLRVSRMPLLQYQALFFNLAKSPKVLADSTVRKALAQSVDRNELIQKVYFGYAKPAYVPIMPQQLGYDPGIEQTNAYSVESANRMLDAAGWAHGSDGLRSKGNAKLAFAITTNDYILNVKSAEDLRDQWAKIGAKVDINVQPTSTLSANVIRPRNFESLLFAESTGSDPDPFVFWHSSQAQNPGYNLAQYKNSAADKLITEARSTFDTAVRASDYKRFQALIANDIPAIFLDQSEFIYVTSPALKGMTLSSLANPEDRFYDVIHWYTETKRIWKK